LTTCHDPIQARGNCWSEWASGVPPWDAIIREGKSKVSPPPPLTLGSDLSGIVEEVGPGVLDFRIGDDVYGVTVWALFCH
jgi:NADPH:quinone reductase-like Zn-dependent oxidoreductase